MAANWPITAADLRKELQVAPGSDDEDELGLYVAVACERIDANTGRNLEPSRHEIGGNLPKTFILAARAAAALWWRQSKNGPRNRPGGQAGEMNGPPAGIDLPSKVKGWLTPYPPRLYPPEKPVFAPVTLIYADGTKIVLSRDANVVTAVATGGTTANNGIAKPIPAGMAPAGNLSSYILNSSTIATSTWALVIDELGALGPLGITTVPLGAYVPGSSFTTTWLADPA